LKDVRIGEGVRLDRRSGWRLYRKRRFGKISGRWRLARRRGLRRTDRKGGGLMLAARRGCRMLEFGGGG
jgi:hypothetical protein